MENGSFLNLSHGGAWSNDEDPVENRSCVNQSCGPVWKPVNPMAYYISGIVLHTLSVVLNLAIAVAFCCKRKLRTKPNVFIFSLAVSGVLHGFVGVVYAATSVENYSHFLHYGGAPRLDYFLYVWQSAMTCNYLNIVAVSTERWIFIARPFLYRKYVGRKLIVRTALFIWLISLAANLDQAIFPFTEDSYRKVISAYRITCLYILPLFHSFWVIMVCFAYAHLVFIANKQLRSIHSQRIGTISEIVIRNRNNNENDRKTKSFLKFFAPPKAQADNPRRRLFTANWKSVKMFVCMFGSFFLTLSPGVYYNTYTMSVRDGYQEASDGLQNFFIRLSDIHFCLIFFVYTQQNKDFRDTYKGVVKYVRCSRKAGSVSPV